MTGSVLERVNVVLFEPQDPINIGATARAMFNMGIPNLRLVRPVPYEAERLEFIAHGTAELIVRRPMRQISMKRLPIASRSWPSRRVDGRPNAPS